MLDRLHTIVTERIDGRRLRVFRALIGALAALKGVDLALQLTNAAGRPSTSWIGPVPDVLTPASSIGATVAWFVASASMAFGWRPRIGSAVLVVLATGLVAADRSLYNQHLYLLALVCLLLAFAANNGTRSVAGSVPRWPLTMIGFVMSAVYGFGALAKLSVDFVTGSVLFAVLARQPVALLAGEWLLDASVLVPLSTAIISAEVVLCVGPWIRRARWLVLAIAGPLHLGMMLLLPLSLDGAIRLAVFGGIQLAILLVVFAPLHPVLVVWDDRCTFCHSWIAAFRRLDWIGQVAYAPISEPDRFVGRGVSAAAAIEALHLVAPDGTVASGFEAVRRLAYVFPATMLFAPWLALPPVRWLGDRAYRRVAEQRRCAIPAAETLQAQAREATD